MIRPANPADYPAILAFWNPLIRETTVSFTSDAKTEASLAGMIAARRAAGREFLVAEIGTAVLGLVTYDQFRGGNGYAHSMEHTIILGAEARGRGVGRSLMDAIEAHARERGAHIMVAGVSAENDAGIAFHRAMGYGQVGRISQAGRKFDRWLDLVLLQKML